MVCCKTYSTCTQSDLGLFAEVRYLQFGSVRIPSDVESRFMQTLLLQEIAETEKFKQEAVVVTKLTEQQVCSDKGNTF